MATCSTGSQARSTWPPDPNQEAARRLATRAGAGAHDITARRALAAAFEEEPGGFIARLSVTLPVTGAPDVVAQHLEHFAVEFRTWILRAAAELSDTTATSGPPSQ